VPFTTGKVVGYPDPPPPFSAARAFPRLQFKNPLYVIREPGADRLLVVEQAGKIRVFRDEQQAETTDLFCEIKDSETYGLTFHPNYAHNRYVYVFSNSGKDGGVVKNRILRFTVEREGRQLCNPKSETLIIDWPSNGHNGGDLAFGPDGMLYLSSGDGTSDSDGDDTGQNISDLASGVLRIDVDRPAAGKQYSVPLDNPFLNLKDARPELWAFGFRNPWRMCFDPATGELLVGDIGQDLWEMIRLVRPGSNHGWSVMEGNHPFQLERRRGPGPLVPPLVEHPHSEARSITGGFVYQGTKFKELQGAYIYGDYSTGKIWAIRHQNGKVTWQREIADTPNEILGFGADSRGEILFVDYGGTLHTLEPSKESSNPADFPRRLSETGLFASVHEHKPHPGLLAYTVNAPLWSDGAAKDRFIAIPGLGQIDFTEQGAWRFPEGTVLVKTFSLGEGAERRRIETRLLVFQQKEWVG
jgi:glucose/arabinose dehydrogenase